MDKKKILDEMMLEGVTGGASAVDMGALNTFIMHNCVFCCCDECPGGHPVTVFETLGADGKCPDKKVSL